MRMLHARTRIYNRTRWPSFLCIQVFVFADRA